MYAAFMEKAIYFIIFGTIAVFGLIGYKYGKLSCSEERRMAQDQYRILELRFNAASADLQRIELDQQNEAHLIQKQLDTVVQEPLYQRECIDDAGLRLANRALATSSGRTTP